MGTVEALMSDVAFHLDIVDNRRTTFWLSRMRTLTFRPWTIAAAAAALVCTGVGAQSRLPAPPPAPALPALTSERLPSPAGQSAMSPQLTVTGTRVILSWLERGTETTLRFAERTPTGWSPARTVVGSRRLIANAADVPAVRLQPDGSLLAHWPESNGSNPEASTLRLSRSRDGGRTWSAPTTPYRDASEAQHGFASAFAGPDARHGIAWLDGRSGGMAVRALAFRNDGSAETEATVDPQVCECCPLATAVSAEGPVVVYRNLTAAGIRDIYISRFVAGRWTAPAAVHDDQWRIEACPVNGPAISAAGRRLAVAWFTAAGGTGHARLAFSDDAGGSFAAPIPVDDQASLGHVSVDWIDDRTAVVGWIEFAASRSLFKVRAVGRNGARGAPLTVAESGRSQYPRLAYAAGDLMFAWTENTQGTTAVRTAHARLTTPTAGDRKP